MTKMLHCHRWKQHERNVACYRWKQLDRNVALLLAEAAGEKCCFVSQVEAA